MESSVVYDLICEGACNPNISIIDKFAQQYMSDRYAISGRQREEDLVKLQRRLQYTTHIVDDRDPRFVVCTSCSSKRKFGG